MRDQLEQLYNELVRLQSEGRDDAAKTLIQERFAGLSEDEQGILLSRLYVSALERTMQEENVIATVKEEGTSALQELAAAEKRLQSGN